MYLKFNENECWYKTNEDMGNNECFDDMETDEVETENKEEYKKKLRVK